MTFGKCIYDGCTRHAVKQSTSACRAHHPVLRDLKCVGCQGPLSTRGELQARRCRRCATARAA
jgi:hypothetical protein